MTTSHIRLSHRPGEVSPNTWSDFKWVHDHEDELLQRYGECVLLVYQEQVIGKGSTIEIALAEAEQTLLRLETEVTPITYFLHQRHPFFRVYPDNA